MKFVLILLLLFSGITPSLATSQTTEKTRERFIIQSEILGEHREILVHLPKGYNASARSYPVIYLTDAEVHMDHTSASADFLYNQHKMPKSIIVGIVNTNRNRDLRPTPINEQIGQTPTGADLFLTFLEKELMVEINKRYRTLPYKVLSGTSFGGLFVIHSFATKPELFNAYIAVSPSLWWDNKATLKHAAKTIKTIPMQFANLAPRQIYISLSNEPDMMTTPYGELVKFLAESKFEKLKSFNRRFPNENHNSGVLISQYKGFSDIFNIWEIPDAPQTLEDLLTRYEAITKQLETSIILPEDRAIGYGTWLYYINRLDEATEMFEWVIKTYPGSATGYHSLGLTYEKVGEIKKALNNFETSLSLSKMNGDPLSGTYSDSVERASALLKDKEPTE